MAPQVESEGERNRTHHVPAKASLCDESVDAAFKQAAQPGGEQEASHVGPQSARLVPAVAPPADDKAIYFNIYTSITCILQLNKAIAILSRQVLACK